MNSKFLCRVLVLASLFFVIPLSALDLLDTSSAWNTEKWEGNSISFKQSAEESVMDFKMPIENQWVQIWKDISIEPSAINNLTIKYSYTGAGHNLEIKFIDDDGSNFGDKIKLLAGKKDWTEVTINLSDFSYFWGGDKTLGHISKIYVAVSGTGDGTVKFKKFILSTGHEPQKQAGTTPVPSPENKNISSNPQDSLLNILNNSASWNSDHWEGNSITFNQTADESIMDFKMPIEGQWVQISKDLDIDFSKLSALQFGYKYTGSKCNLEVKLVDEDGSVFGNKVELTPTKDGWVEKRLASSDFTYFWGGDKTLAHIKMIYFAIAGTGNGTLKFNKMSLAIGQPESQASPDKKKTERISIPPSKYWNNPKDWVISGDNESKINISSLKAKLDYGLQVDYALRKGSYGYVEFKKEISEPFNPEIPFTFWIKAKADSDLEMKFVDKDGSIFYRKVPLKNAYTNWTQIVLYLNNTEYGWGGKNDEFDGWGCVQFAISGAGEGTVFFDGMCFGQKGLKASFSLAGAIIDPNATMPGIGFKQRRDAVMNPEDPLVLKGLKQVQDSFSPGKQILPSMENNEAQTFNNALVAMAFIIKGERERAERILDFFAAATNRNNQEINKQNFFYKGEPRGFFQWVELNATTNAAPFHYSLKSKNQPNRWMGDMAWLMLAYKCYEKEYNSQKYADIMKIMKDYLVSLYTNASDGPGGYLRHGWINGDKKLNENFGHHEGNIDAWVVMKLCGEDKIAENIKIWLDRNIKGKTLPLDLYTWRTLAYGSSASSLLNIPDYDLRFRKTLTVKGRQAMGFYSSPDYNVNNIWLDGTGHIACAYSSIGDIQRGNFYANQLDSFLIDRKINGVITRSIPYTANTEGGYQWVDTKKGFISVAAWYIYAKNRFNPYYFTKDPIK